MFVYCYQFICKFYFPEIIKNRKENFFKFFFSLKCFLKLTKSPNGAHILSFKRLLLAGMGGGGAIRNTMKPFFFETPLPSPNGDILNSPKSLNKEKRRPASDLQKRTLFGVCHMILAGDLDIGTRRRMQKKISINFQIVQNF